MHYIGIIGAVASYEFFVHSVLKIKKSNIDQMKDQIEISHKTLAVFDEAIKKETNPKIKAQHEQSREEFYTRDAKVSVPFNHEIPLNSAEALLKKKVEDHAKFEKASLIHQAKKLMNHPL